MPSFQYKAIDGSGASVKGVTEAETTVAVVESLLTKGLHCTDVRIAKGSSPAAQASESAPSVSFGSRVSPLEIALFLRQLSTLIDSDVPLMQSLSLLHRQSTNPLLHQILGAVIEDIKGGTDFSGALSKWPKTFSAMVVSMVRVGETGGVLGPILDQLADITEREQQTRSEVRAAMIYPVIVVLVGIVVVSILMVFVVPKLTATFLEMGAALPLPTEILISISTFAESYWWIVLGCCIAAFVALQIWRKTEKGGMAFDRIVLRIPLMGSLAKKAAISRFSRALGVLIGGGVPLLEALAVVKGVLDNAALSAVIDRATEGLKEGESLANELAKETDMFPELVTHMIGVGENSGTLDRMLLKIAETFEWQTQQAVKMMLSLLGPVMILSLAVVIGFIALALILPMFTMQQFMV